MSRARDSRRYLEGFAAAARFIEFHRWHAATVETLIDADASRYGRGFAAGLRAAWGQ